MKWFERWSRGLSSLPTRVLLFGLVPSGLALIAFVAMFFGVRALVAQSLETEDARVAMEAARASALQVERSRAGLQELFATSVRGDLDQLLALRDRFNHELPELMASIGSAGLDSDLSALDELPERVLDAAEALIRRDVPASRAIMTEVDATMQQLADELDHLAQRRVDEEDRARETAAAALQWLSWVAAVLLVVAVAITVFGAIGVERLIRKPLAGILQGIESVRRGAAESPFPAASGGDEISRIQQAINALQAHEQERQESVRQLEHLAQYDALTGLPNRVLLADRIQQALARSRRARTMVAIVFIDLDDFKTVNDDYGHKFGDGVLAALASNMEAALREEDTLARLGGDEFVAVLPDLPSLDGIEPVLDRLLESVSEPTHCQEKVIHVTASAGVAVYPQDHEIDPDQLIRQADQAMYRAKQTGRNTYALFDASQEQLVREQHELIARLRLALERNEFSLFYQPKVDLVSGEIVGAEALLRWRHPEKGLLSPAEFLFAVERHLLAVELGQWVFEQALSDCELWRSAGHRIQVAINLFPLQLQQEDFFTGLSKLLARYSNLNASDIELEIVETAALEDIEQASKVIRECAGHGIEFALDDFGTGYSSLTYLRRLPVKTLKLDQSFVRGMLDDREDVVIIQGVLDMARAFGLEVVAEGVETLEHGEQLRAMGCRLAQGYAIARPLTADQLLHWVRTWELPERWRAVPPPAMS